jgi:hypothetical protein
VLSDRTWLLHCALSSAGIGRIVPAKPGGEPN